MADLAAMLVRHGRGGARGGDLADRDRGRRRAAARPATRWCPTGWWPPPTWPPSAWPAARSRSPTPGPTTWRCCCARSARWGWPPSMGPDGLRATRPTGACVAADVATLPYPGVATDYSPLLVAMLTGGRRGGDPHREPLLGPLPLRRGAAPHGRRHPDRGPPRRGARRAPALGRPGARPRHPGRRGAGAGRAGGRGRDRGERRPPHRPGLRGPGRRAALPGRQGDRAGERRRRRADPAAAPRRAARRTGDRVALARLLSYIERGGETGDWRWPAWPTGPRCPTPSASPARRGPASRP